MLSRGPTPLDFMHVQDAGAAPSVVDAGMAARTRSVQLVFSDYQKFWCGTPELRTP